MKKVYCSLFLALVLSLSGTQAFAYDIAVKNADSITIYYIYINDGKDLEVCGDNYGRSYTGSVVIPEEVTYMNRTRKVTSIGEYNQEIKGDTNVEIIPVIA